MNTIKISINRLIEFIDNLENGSIFIIGIENDSYGIIDEFEIIKDIIINTLYEIKEQENKNYIEGKDINNIVDNIINSGYFDNVLNQIIINNKLDQSENIFKFYSKDSNRYLFADNYMGQSYDKSILYPLKLGIKDFFKNMSKELLAKVIEKNI